MTVRELVAKLLDLTEVEVGDFLLESGGDPDRLLAEVRLAHQPHWPFECGIAQALPVETNAADISDIDDVIASGTLTESELAEADAERDRLMEENKTVVYIAEASQIGYLPGDVTKLLGWGR